MVSPSTARKSSLPLLYHSVARFVASSLASVATIVLVPLMASGMRAQGVRASSPARDTGAHSWVHESWTVKVGLPVNSINALLQDRDRRRSKLHAHVTRRECIRMTSTGWSKRSA